MTTLFSINVFGFDIIKYLSKINIKMWHFQDSKCCMNNQFMIFGTQQMIDQSYSPCMCSTLINYSIVKGYFTFRWSWGYSAQSVTISSNRQFFCGETLDFCVQFTSTILFSCSGEYQVVLPVMCWVFFILSSDFSSSGCTLGDLNPHIENTFPENYSLQAIFRST